MAAGAITFAAMLFGVLRFDATIMMASVAALLLGIVVWGSNGSTAKQAAIEVDKGRGQSGGIDRFDRSSRDCRTADIALRRIVGTRAAKYHLHSIRSSAEDIAMDSISCVRRRRWLLREQGSEGACRSFSQHVRRRRLATCVERHRGLYGLCAPARSGSGVCRHRRWHLPQHRSRRDLQARGLSRHAASRSGRSWRMPPIQGECWQAARRFRSIAARMAARAGSGADLQLPVAARMPFAMPRDAVRATSEPAGRNLCRARGLAA